ncbi:MAG: TetR family transcriptional regulator [Proteobacteria bacterium]|nr:TetR family transcriptional regulator [Pseudomonadota bacterium]
MGSARQARAIETRQLLLDATLEALVEVGYAGTTTQEVCRRAGASRGKLLHHFPRRTDLLIAALEEVLTQRVQGFVDDHQPGEQDLAALITAMWAHWKGPALYAWLELAIAARTNAELREPLRVVMRQFDVNVRAAFGALLPGALPPALRDTAPMMVFAALNGLAVDRIYSDEATIQPTLALLISVSQQVLESDHG